MPCRSCAERREMIAKANTQGGLRNVVRVLPLVVRSIVERPPVFRSVVTRKAKDPDVIDA